MSDSLLDDPTLIEENSSVMRMISGVIFSVTMHKYLPGGTITEFISFKSVSSKTS